MTYFPLHTLPLSFFAMALASAAPAMAEDQGRKTLSAAEQAISKNRTHILDKAAANRLAGSKGLTLQWIDWNHRGTASIARQGNHWTLRGAQFETGGPGKLLLDGTITEIGKDYFTFLGKISIRDTPDRGRSCEKTKSWHFAITQNRPYYRLREFEWCDGLTDYIDIYF